MHDIMSYRFPEADRRINNPYLIELRHLVERIRESGGDDNEILKHRAELTARYAFSVPTIGILELVAFH